MVLQEHGTLRIWHSKNMVLQEHGTPRTWYFRWDCWTVVTCRWCSLYGKMAQFMHALYNTIPTMYLHARTCVCMSVCDSLFVCTCVYMCVCAVALLRIFSGYQEHDSRAEHRHHIRCHWCHRRGSRSVSGKLRDTQIRDLLGRVHSVL